MLPDLNPSLETLFERVEADSDHNLAMVDRYALYEQLDAADRPGPVRFIVGWLSILSVRRVLPLWKINQFNWINEEDTKNIQIRELPETIVVSAENVLEAKESIEEAKRKQKDFWHMLTSRPTIGEEIIDYIKENAPLELVCVCNAAFKALSDTVYWGAIAGFEQDTDDTAPFDSLDAAGSAMLAYAGGNEIAPVNLEKRREFWRWWLTEAVPQAWELAQTSYKFWDKE